jgi:hypothetical protein
MVGTKKGHLRHYGKDHMERIKKLEEKTNIRGGNNSRNLGPISSWMKMAK